MEKNMAFCKFSTEFVANNKTEIDNIFINDYLPSAPENCIKVYLYGLYLCSSNLANDNSLEAFARHLDLDEDEIIACFSYWQEEGLVQVLSTRPIEIRYIPLKNIISGTKLYKPEKYDVFNRQAQELFEGQREITKNEYYEYYEFLERSHMQQEALLMIMKYCIDNKKANVGYSYILTVAKNWASEGVLSVEDVEERLCKFEENNNDLGILMKTMGLKRNTYIEERTMFKKWTEELGYTLDVLNYIAKKLKAKSKANFEKLDLVIMKYFSLGLFSIQEIEDYENRKNDLYDLARKVNNQIGVYYENLETVVENYISKWLNLGFDEDTILEIASYCRKTSIRTLEGVDNKIQKFFKLGILNLAALHTYLDKVVAQDKEIQEILEKVSLQRKVNYLDRELFKTWTENWNMPKDVISHAATFAVGKLSPMQYINSILSTWYQNGVKTLQDAKKQPAILKETPTKTTLVSGRSYKKEDLDALIQSIDEVEI